MKTSVILSSEDYEALIKVREAFSERKILFERLYPSGYSQIVLVDDNELIENLHKEKQDLKKRIVDLELEIEDFKKRKWWQI